MDFIHEAKSRGYDGTAFGPPFVVLRLGAFLDSPVLLVGLTPMGRALLQEKYKKNRVEAEFNCYLSTRLKFIQVF